jgi:hypothetical protein
VEKKGRRRIKREKKGRRIWGGEGEGGEGKENWGGWRVRS